MNLQQFFLSYPTDALISLLKRASDRGVEITTTKVAKFLYLADLRSVELYGESFSGFTWTWDNHGPWDSTIYRSAETLEAQGIVKTTEASYGRFNGKRFELVSMTQETVDHRFASIIDVLLDDYGNCTASALRDLTYNTPPMLEAQRCGARGVKLDLHGGGPVPQASSVKARLRALRDRLPAQRDEGDLSAMLDEHDEWSDTRRRANGEIL
ncbi:Panacea domain-containing protein [Dietzia sp. WMMA184]|uniref:Panacea domain-containing protein n=1 Tax=Dietzia sp. WMMA184 TaxID=2039808 RepID=UPI000BDF2AB6|nr:Panacea domain-containing protein [Dietzia sp. WMMA184]